LRNASLDQPQAALRAMRFARVRITTIFLLGYFL
jgi:hypothetical protein